MGNGKGFRRGAIYPFDSFHCATRGCCCNSICSPRRLFLPALKSSSSSTSSSSLPYRCLKNEIHSHTQFFTHTGHHQTRRYPCEQKHANQQPVSAATTLCQPLRQLCYDESFGWNNVWFRCRGYFANNLVDFSAFCIAEDKETDRIFLRIFREAGNRKWRE